MGVIALMEAQEILPYTNCKSVISKAHYPVGLSMVSNVSDPHYLLLSTLLLNVIMCFPGTAT